MVTELKTCPFCGGEAEILGIQCIWVHCTSCLAETLSFDSEEEAIKAWNRRIENKGGIDFDYDAEDL